MFFSFTHVVFSKPDDFFKDLIKKSGHIFTLKNISRIHLSLTNLWVGSKFLEELHGSQQEWRRIMDQLVYWYNKVYQDTAFNNNYSEQNSIVGSYLHFIKSVITESIINEHDNLHSVLEAI